MISSVSSAVETESVDTAYRVKQMSEFLKNPELTQAKFCEGDSSIHTADSLRGPMVSW